MMLPYIRFACFFSVFALHFPVVLHTQVRDVWTQQYPDYRYVNLDADFVSESTGWVITTDGSVLKTTDGAKTWLKRLHHSGTSLNLVTAQSDVDVCVFTSDGTCYASNDGGRTWSESPTGLSSTKNAFFLDREYGYITGSALSRTTDGGVHWSIVSDRKFDRVAFQDKKSGVALDGIHVTQDSGRTWETKYVVKTNPFDWEYFDEVVMFDSTWIVLSLEGDHSGLWRYKRYITVDGGQTWRVTSHSAENEGIYGIVRYGSMSLAAIRWSQLVISTDSGATWTHPSPLPDKFTRGRRPKLIPIDSLNVWGYGFVSDLYFTSDGGSTWESLTYAPRQSLRSVSFVDESTGWAGGDNGTMLKTTDGGEHWMVLGMPTSSRLLRIFAFDRERVVFHTVTNNKVYRTLDGGLRIMLLPNPLKLLPFFVDDSTGWGISPDGQALYRTQNAGEAWQPLPLVPPGTIVNLHALSSMHCNLLYDSTRIARTEDGGISWSVEQIAGFDESPARDVDFVDALTGMLGVQLPDGTGYRYLVTADGGRRWVAQPDTPPFTKKVVLADANRRWALTDESGVAAWLSLDAGTTWYPTSLATAHAIAALPDGNAWAVGDSGRVMHSNIQVLDAGRMVGVSTTMVLGQNYPNPFGPGSSTGSLSTTIEAVLPGSDATLRIYDMLGRVRAALPVSKDGAGSPRIVFAPLSAGIDLPTGIYMYRLESDMAVVSRKMLWMR